MIDNALKDKLEKVAEYIIEKSARETTSGNYITYAEEIPSELITLDEYMRHWTTL